MATKKQTLSDRIQELRKLKGLSQLDLADKIKVSRAQMNRYENQNVQPPADVIGKMAQVLDTTVDYLLNGATEEKAKATLKDAKVLEQYKELEALPDNEKNVILKVVNALIRDYKTRVSYTV